MPTGEGQILDASARGTVVLMGPVERAIRGSLVPPLRLATPARGAPFVLKALNERGVVLLLGEKEAYTPISWRCVEGIADYLRGRSWVKIGSKFDVGSDPGTLDAYLKTCIKRATAGWVASVLEAAGVVETRVTRPAEVRLRLGF